MAKAFIFMEDGSRKAVEPHVALSAYNVKTGKVTGTAQQVAFSKRIRRIFLPPSARPDGYTPINPYAGERPATAPPKHVTDENDPPTKSKQRLTGADYETRYR